MRVFVTNGLTTVELENMHPGSPGNGTWFQKSFSLNSLISPTANMRLIVHISDSGAIHNIVEGGLDKFEVTDLVGLQENTPTIVNLKAWPNPFSNEFNLQFAANSEAVVTITDVTGRSIDQYKVSTHEGSLLIGRNWQQGIYFATLTTEDGAQKTIKLIKN
jgi:hypothetical protein